jgi:hypothetical protein
MSHGSPGFFGPSGGGGGSGPSTFDTLSGAYDTGTSASDQTLSMSLAKGPLTLISSSLAAGTEPVLILKNDTPATALAPVQTSPAIELMGQGWSGVVSTANIGTIHVIRDANSVFDSKFVFTNAYSGVLSPSSAVRIGSAYGYPYVGRDDAITGIQMAVAAQLTLFVNTQRIDFTPTEFYPIDDTILLGRVSNRWQYGYFSRTVDVRRDNLSQSISAAIILHNDEPATATETTQVSPAITLTGAGWETTGNSSQLASWTINTMPVNGVSLKSELRFIESINGTPSTMQMRLTPSGNGSGFSLFDSSGNSGINVWNLGSEIRGAGHSLYLTNGDAFYPNSNNVLNFGAVANRWRTVYASQYSTCVQVVNVTSETITASVAQGEMIRFMMSQSVSGGWCINDGKPGSIACLEFIQDAAGSKIISNHTASILLAGGVINLTATANKRDVLTLRWDSVENVWVEASRAMNV